MEKGTLYHLRNVINRTSVPSDPQNNMNAAEDFLLLVFHAHTIAAARSILQFMDVPTVSELADKILVNFVHLSPLPESKAGTSTPPDDGVQFYAVEVLSLSLIWHGFHDAIREGDGERIMRYWKLLLILFKASNKYNYAKEAVTVLMQCKYSFSERQRHQLLWSRCVNTKGCIGGNIPCDLHMEHLNRRLKTMLRNVVVTPKVVERAGKCLHLVDNVCTQFERQTASSRGLGYRATPKFGRDLQTVLKVLEEENVFMPTKREHPTFKFTEHLMDKITRKDLIKKIEKNIKNIYLV